MLELFKQYTEKISIISFFTSFKAELCKITLESHRRSRDQSDEAEKLKKYQSSPTAERKLQTFETYGRDWIVQWRNFWEQFVVSEFSEKFLKVCDGKYLILMMRKRETLLLRLPGLF